MWTSPSAALSHFWASCHLVPERRHQHLSLHFPSLTSCREQWGHPSVSFAPNWKNPVSSSAPHWTALPALPPAPLGASQCFISFLNFWARTAHCAIASVAVGLCCVWRTPDDWGGACCPPAPADPFLQSCCQSSPNSGLCLALLFPRCRTWHLLNCTPVMINQYLIYLGTSTKPFVPRESQ